LYPRFKNKYKHKSLYSPADFLKYHSARGSYKKFKPPEGVIFCYSARLLNYILKNHKTERIRKFYGEMYLLKETKGKIGIMAEFGIGAPVVVTIMDELSAFGIKKFISIGTAGGLQKNLKIGDLVVCEKSIRDEGTSYHYLKHSKYASASKTITSKIKKTLDMHEVKYYSGVSWTIDAPYRETIAELKKYRKEGVLTVEMELSALFALAKYRGVEMGAILTVSDLLSEYGWSPKFHLKKTQIGLETLYRVGLDALL
jgi:uridine phosphorylase